ELAKIAGITDTATGAWGSLVFYTRPNATIAERMRITSAGNVGIGTTNPQQVLTVIGNGLFSGDLALNGNDINLGTGSATSTISGGFGIGVGTTTPGAAFAVATSTAGLNTAMLLSNLGSGYTFWAEDSANDTTPFVIQADGNVGIGTKGPGDLLHLYAAASADRGIRIDNENTGTAATSIIDFYQGTTRKGYIAQGGSGFTGVGGAYAMQILNNQNAPIAFFTNGGNERMRVAGDGNVGIGSTNPQQVLTVIGNGLFSGDMALNGNDINLGTGTATTTISGGFGIGVGTTTPGAAFAVATSTAGLNTAMLLSNLGSGYTFWAEDSANDTTPFVIQADGNVGVGTKGPGKKLDISGVGNTDGLRISGASDAANVGLIIQNTGTGGVAWSFSSTGAGHSDGNGKLFLYPDATFGTPVLAVQTNGNVGIGTVNPIQALHVVGQCVTGDTLLKRKQRRRRKNANGEWVEEEYFENVRIDEIEAGDEILTLDEHTGKLVVSRVNALMDMGVKEIYKLTTATGKTIRTTGNHPYLVAPDFTQERVAVFIDGANFEKSIAQIKGWADYPEMAHSFGQGILRFYQVRFGTSGQDGFFARLKHLGFSLITKSLKTITEKGKDDAQKANFDVELAVDAVDMKDRYDVAVLFSGDSDFAYLTNYLQKKGKRVIVISPWRRTARELRLAADVYLNLKQMPFVKEKGNQKRPRRADHDRLSPALPILSQVHPYVKNGVWTKVADMKEGQMIATEGSNGKPIYERIIAIEKMASEQVYDIEVEGTHNFVGNDIIAHNTYISSDLSIGGNDIALGTGTATT
ncbi:MAG: NYN domain-containing protein, partial [bacterium]|nr:NYN domain-containing protein [bacterium]